MIVVGASLGGTLALQQLLAALPARFPTSLIIVIHRHRDSDVGPVALLQRACALRVTEALDKEPIESACVYVAPADYHLLVDGDHLALSVDDPVRFARPSVDVLFESAAASARNVIAVVLTGGGVDGARGAAAIERNGGVVLVQDPLEAACGDMPVATIAATVSAEVLSLESIPRRLQAIVEARMR